MTEIFYPTGLKEFEIRAEHFFMRRFEQHAKSKFHWLACSRAVESERAKLIHFHSFARHLTVKYAFGVTIITISAGSKQLPLFLTVFSR